MLTRICRPAVVHRPLVEKLASVI